MRNCGKAIGTYMVNQTHSSGGMRSRFSGPDVFSMAQRSLGQRVEAMRPHSFTQNWTKGSKKFLAHG